MVNYSTVNDKLIPRSIHDSPYTKVRIREGKTSGKKYGRRDKYKKLVCFQNDAVKILIFVGVWIVKTGHVMCYMPAEILNLARERNDHYIDFFLGE